MNIIRKHTTTLLVGLATAVACTAQTPPNHLDITSGPIPVSILLQGPADTEADPQIICLFAFDSTNTLQGSLIAMNNKLKGLLTRIRAPILFRGELGETILVVAPPSGTIPAKRLLIIGLGDSRTFTPKRMDLVGSIAYREATRLGAEHPFFAPTVLDGGVTKYSTGETSEQVVRGILRAAVTEHTLKQFDSSPGVAVKGITFLAGQEHAPSTRDGIEKVFGASK